jgi:ribosome-binding ATPase
MEIGIVGLPQSGKSTLFEIMTGIVKSHASHGESCIRGQATVPDKRLDKIAEAYPREKVIHARIPFVDVNAVGEKAWDAMRQNLSGAEAILHIIDGFTVPDLQECTHQYRKLEEELMLSDLLIVENRLQKLHKTPKNALKAIDMLQLELLPGVKEHLEGGKPLRAMILSADESFALRSFSFWSIKPEMVVVNEAEDSSSLTESFRNTAALSSPVLGICCQMESELAGLAPEEQKEFLSSMGIEAPAFEKIIHAAFALLGRISFFTIGDHEIRVWVIPEGSKAPKAAAAIHKDFERGFIKAEVASFDDFQAHGNTIQGVKAAGRLRLEGKEYVVRDGDIITFRFNV